MKNIPRIIGPVIVGSRPFCIDYAGSLHGSAVEACTFATCLNDKVPACVHPTWKGLRKDITTHHAEQPKWCPLL